MAFNFTPKKKKKKEAFKPNSKFDNSVGFKIKFFPNPTKLTLENNLLNSRKLENYK